MKVALTALFILFAFLLIMFACDTKAWKGQPEAGDIWYISRGNPFLREEITILETKDEWVKYKVLGTNEIHYKHYWEITRDYSKSK
jgi:hypothetical protein